MVEILYKDAMMLVVNKPPGIPVHKGPKGGKCLEDSFDALRFGLPRAPALAHRLDRDTSGCLVLGRHKQALKRLGALFSSGKIGKVYWAVVIGEMPEKEGVINLPLRKKSTEQRGWWMETGEGGQEAVTHYKVLRSSGGFSWVEFSPKTGRTHQIRVHSASLGCPVLGDPVYGGGREIPMHLHSRSVEVPLYPRKDAVFVTAPPPFHMLNYVTL